MMPRKAKQDAVKIAVIVAIIGAIGYIGQGYFQGLGVVDKQDRPILEWSLGANNTYPKNELDQDASGYFINLFMDNRGKSDGKIIFEVKGTNSQLRLSPDLPWAYDQSLHFTITPRQGMNPYKIYVEPDVNANMISFELLSQDVQDRPPFQETNSYIPLKITYQMTNGQYVLIH